MRILLLAAFLLPILQTTPAPTPTKMTDTSGSFEVTIAPTGHAPDPSLQSLTINKTFHGGVEGTSKGEMLAAGDPAQGNAGYVAIERVTGAVDGKTGTFALMHTATMVKGTPPQMSVIVVPGSGTGELSGLYGTLTITIAADGKHTYTLRYAFAPK